MENRMNSPSSKHETAAIETADRLREAGMRVLAGGIESILRDCGRLTVSGSYYLDLMAWPDLDLYVEHRHEPEFRVAFLQIGPRIASVADVVSLRFKDHVRYPEPLLPCGLYWGVRIRQKPDLNWKLDIWALPADAIDIRQTELDRIKARLTPDLRRIIVEAKQALLLPDGRTPIQSGYHIYRAVIDHGLRSVPEITEYVRLQGASL